MNKISKASRIGIIGAGPSGLAAAEALRELGYPDITLLEKRDRAGGMSWSFTYQTPDHREIIYEMGSVQPTNSKPLNKLIKKYGIHIGKNNLGKGANPKKPFRLKAYSIKDRKILVDFVKYRLGHPISQYPSIIRDLFVFFKYAFKYRHLNRPGYQVSDEITKELSLSFQNWIKDRNFKILDESLAISTAIATYGNPESSSRFPAIGVMKFILSLLRFPLRYINGSIKMTKEGYQELWTRVSKQNKVLFGVDIKKISRKPNEVEVVTEDGKIIFEKLIISSSPKETLHFLDTTIEERGIFNRVLYESGWRVAFLAKNLPHDGAYFLTGGFNNQSTDHVMFFYPEGEVTEGVWLYSAVLPVSQNIPIDPFLRNTEKIFKDHFKGEVVEWINSKYWDEYSSHFSLEDTRNGFYQKLEELQGKNNTYYVGGLIACHSHALVSEYSYAMVEKYFR